MVDVGSPTTVIVIRCPPINRFIPKIAIRKAGISPLA